MRDPWVGTVLIIDDEIDCDTPGSNALNEISSELRNLGLPIITSLTGSGGVDAFRRHPEIGCVLLDYHLNWPEEQMNAWQTCQAIRQLNELVPIFLITDKESAYKLDREFLARLSGYVWKLQDNPSLVAGRIREAILTYNEELLPPFLSALFQYVQKCRYSWHTPGHSGGDAFLKSAPGGAFYRFFGENTLRSDLSVSVPELGSLLDHTGPLKEAEDYAARIFTKGPGNQTYFVTNGTSTANKIVINGVVTGGDTIWIDRNCHKSVVHAAILAGCKVRFLPRPQLNQHCIPSLIGPAALAEFVEASCSDQPRAVVVTNSTYDGLCYSVGDFRDIVSRTGCEPHLLYDEAWFAYAAFHDLYAGRYAMSLEPEKSRGGAVFSTQSTHKLLMAFSQASMIHVKGNVERERFSEAFMMHTSTSPQYGIIASLDTATKIMDVSGKALIAEAVEEAISFRKTLDKMEIGFEAWQPPQAINTQVTGANDNGRTARSGEQPFNPINGKREGEFSIESNDWSLRSGLPGEKQWHGFSDLTPPSQFELQRPWAMLDPIKVTILCRHRPSPVPASIVAAFLRRRGLVVEKNGPYTILVLFSIGITRGKSGSLLASLCELDEMIKKDVSLGLFVPGLAQAEKESMPVREYLSEACRQTDTIAEALQRTYAVTPTMSELTMQQIYGKMVSGKAELTALNKAQGRFAATMIVPYPPGIPLLAPGERIEEEHIMYLDKLYTTEAQYPQLGIEVHGLHKRKDGPSVFVF